MLRHHCKWLLGWTIRDVLWIFQPLAPSNCSSSLSSTIKKHGNICALPFSASEVLVLYSRTPPPLNLCFVEIWPFKVTFLYWGGWKGQPNLLGGGDLEHGKIKLILASA